MLSINYIKDNIDKVKQNIVNRKFPTELANIDKLLEIEKQLNSTRLELDSNRQKRNENAEIIKNNKGVPSQELIDKGRLLKEEGTKLEAEFNKLNEQFKEIMLWIPNMALDDVPIGKGEDENIEIKAWSVETGFLTESQLGGVNKSIETFKKDKKVVPHWEIGKALDLIDLEAGAKVSGSRFYYLKNEAYLIMYGIFNVLMKKLISEGFNPMYVPVIVKDLALFGSSQFPADRDQTYKISTEYVESNTELFLVGSSEPSAIAYYADTIIDKSKLPLKHFTQSPCFRSEAGSWGKDVRGIKRAHQFEKLEMVAILENDLNKAIEMHEYFLSITEWLLQSLKIPYHVINMCTGDLGYAAAAKKYDVEIFLPSENAYMEVASDSITTDFQSRRLNIKSRDKDNNKEFVYTINNTGATHRLLIGILEHYQNEDGSVTVPEILREYVGKDVISLN